MNTKVSEDLAHIKEMMERSSRFISLSGLSGIGAGIVGLIAGFVAMYWTSGSEMLIEKARMSVGAGILVQNLILLGTFALLLAVFCGCFFTIRKSRKLGLQIWTSTTKKVLIQLAIPLLV